MARFERATWRGPVPNMTRGQMVSPIKGLVLHIEQGTQSGTDAWFHNPAAQVSAHFGNPKSGPLEQWVDTDDKAWAIVAGNRYWISLENEGDTGELLTDSQIANCAQLLAWLHLSENVPLQATDDADGRGLGYHAMGGDAWGGHLQCPGQAIIDQRPKIIAQAKQLVAAELAAEPGHPPLAEMAAQTRAADTGAA